MNKNFNILQKNKYRDLKPTNKALIRLQEDMLKEIQNNHSFNIYIN